MNDTITTLLTAKKAMANFVQQRDWQQFHTPKNLSMSIAIEAAELMEKFQWSSVEESVNLVDREKKQISHEIADIFSYLLSFCNLHEIDLALALENKLKINAKKNPIEKVKGSFEKYIEVKKNKKNNVK